MFRKMILAVALLCAPAAAAQDAFRPGAPPIDSNPPPMKLQCWTGTAWAACSASNPVPTTAAPPTGGSATQTQGTSAAGSAPSGNPNLTAGVNNAGFVAPISVSGTGAGRGNVYVELAGMAPVNSGVGDSGAPMKVGGYASGGIPGTVANGQRVNDWNALTGAKVFSPGSATLGYSLSLTASPSLVQDANGSARPLGVIGMVTDGSNGFFTRDFNSAVGGTGVGVPAVGNLGRDATGAMRAFAVDPAGTQIVRDLDGQAVPVTPVTAAGVIFSTPTTGYAGVSFQTGTAANGGTWNFQGSNDSTDGINGNWVSINAQQLNSSATSATQTPSAGFFIPAVMNYVRVNVTGTLTNAVGGTAVLRSLAPLPTVIQNQTINNNKMIYWNEIVNGAVAVGGTVQNSRDTGVGSGGEYRYVQFTCQLNSGPTASSTLSLSLQGSTDNTNWINYIAPIPVTAANTYIQQTIRMTFRYNRCRLFNDTGGTATTGTSLSTQYGE